MPGPDSSRPQAVPPEEKEQQARGLHGVGAESHTANAAAGANERPLNEREVQLLRKVFGDGISYAPVRLVRMAELIAMLNGSRAFVLGNALNLPGRDFDAISHGEKQSLLVHESTHIWQYQHHGWSYATESLRAQFFGDGYDYVKALREGKPWRRMNPEQQAEMIQDAFRGGYFEAPGARFGAVGQTGIVVAPGHPPPEGFTDYTTVLVAALEELRTPA